MRNKDQNIRSNWWENNWHRQVGLITFVMIIFALTTWWRWASSFGVISGADRDAEIRALIDSNDIWEESNMELARLRQIILANPSSISNPLDALNNAEIKANDATEAFELAGFKALKGELIIISGVILQVILTLFLITIIRARFSRKHRGESTTNDRIKWVEKIRAGQALEDEDEILKFVNGEAGDVQLSRAEIKQGEQVTDAYRRLLAKCRKFTEDEIPWLQISSLLYKMMLICRERGAKGLESKLRIEYKQVRGIINHAILSAIGYSIGTPIFFLVIFTLLSIAWNQLAGPILGAQLSFWRFPIQLVGAAFVANGFVHVVVASVARWFAEKTWTNLDDVIIGAIVGPSSALATAVILLWAISILTGPNSPPFEFGPFLVWAGHVAVASTWRSLVMIFVGTWFAIFFLNHVVVWVLEQWVRRTTQIYDDMFVKSIQVFGTFILLAFGGGAALAVFNGPLSQATGIDNVILPYTIIVSVFTAIIGYAASAGFENFFGGLLLQIEKPFERGERIVLTDGQICDVREVGMRCTVLYNVTENTEVSVPNSEMAKMIITNTSRPDLELRITIPSWVAPKVHNLKIAGAILLDIAYLEKEIDQMRVFKEELTLEEREKTKRNILIRGYRTTIEQGMERLVARYEKITGTIISQMIGGGEQEPERVFKINEDQQDPYLKVLANIKELRKKYAEVLKRENDWLFHGIMQVENVETRVKEKLRDYRRAINEIVYSKTVSSQLLPIESSDDDPLSELIKNVGHRELIDTNNLINAIYYLSGSNTVRERVDQSTLYILRKKLREFEAQRLGLVLHINDEVAILENYIYAVGEQYPDVRPELDFLISEIDKEPSVSSEYTDDGHVRLTLSCYAIYLERRLEIQHKINRDIEWRFSNEGIIFDMSQQAKENLKIN